MRCDPNKLAHSYFSMGTDAMLLLLLIQSKSQRTAEPPQDNPTRKNKP